MFVLGQCYHKSAACGVSLPLHIVSKVGIVFTASIQNRYQDNR